MRPFSCGTAALEASLAQQRWGNGNEPVRRADPVSPTAGSRAKLSPAGRTAACLSPAHIFPYEDTAQVLVSNYSTDQLLDLVVDAGNALTATHGDLYDFVGIWFNFPLHHNNFGEAVYFAMENDATGIGSYFDDGLELFNRRAEYGVAGVNIEGFVFLNHEIGSQTWQPGTGPAADFTRMAISHELAHRFINFLPELLDGRNMQGVFDSCGKEGHWDWKVDGQGSVMHISEWVGTNPAVRVGGNRNLDFNHETGGTFSYVDLYLMGYIFPEEVDAWISELRYMNDADCQSDYFGTITHFTTADIIASAGPRVPSAADEDQHYRMGWIMIHQPGDLPSSAELDKAIAILEQHMIDWNMSTLERGTMDHSLFADCNCNGTSDAEDISGGSPDTNENGIPDECELSIPTLSAWGLVITALLLLSAGVVIIRRLETQRAYRP